MKQLISLLILTLGVALSARGQEMSSLMFRAPVKSPEISDGSLASFVQRVFKSQK